MEILVRLFIIACFGIGVHLEVYPKAHAISSQIELRNTNTIKAHHGSIKKLKTRSITARDIDTEHIHVSGDQEICGDLYVDGFISASSIDLLSAGSMTFGDIDVNSITVATDATIDGTVSSCDGIVGCDLFLNDSVSFNTGNVIKNGNSFIHTFPGSISNNTFMGENSGNFSTDPSSTQNSGFGNNTLGGNLLGANNTAMGSFALALNGSSSGLSNNNTAVGAEALRVNGSSSGEASYNTAVGALAMVNSSQGSNNTAIGSSALQANTLGMSNVAVGMQSSLSNTIGSFNTSVGTQALSNLVATMSNIGQNTALGYQAGINLTDGTNNVYIANEGMALESNTIRIGDVQTATYIAGINGTAVGTNSPVVINSNGQLGTTVSSRRFKNDIHDIGSASDLLMKLRPVMFKYNNDDTNQVNYGFIAEEVAQIYPELVTFDEYGNPYTVKYHLLYALLLNEIQKNRSLIDVHDQHIKALDIKYEARIQQLIDRIIALESQR